MELYEAIYSRRDVREFLPTFDRQQRGPHVLGRNTIPATGLYSTCCAIQNLWLPARAEGLDSGTSEESPCRQEP